MVRIGVAGGGLAGLLFAKWIKERKPEFEVRVFERRKRERYRVDCAEGLVNARNAFRLVGEDAKRFVRNYATKFQWRFKIGERTITSTVRYPNPFCWILDRKAWQLAIADEAERLGVEIEFGKSVKPEEMEYEVVVDARGSKMGDHCATAVYKIVTGDFRKIADTLIFELHENGDLLFWIFPLGRNVANIGCGAERAKMKELNEFIANLEFEVWDVIKKGAGLLNYSYSAALLSGKEEEVVRKVDGRDIVKIGDAAGLVDPFTGEGMSGAILSAHLLADSLAKYGREKYSEVYAKLLKKENEYLKLNLQAMLARRSNLRKFVQVIKILDGVNGKYLTSKLFPLRYPLRALKIMLA